MRATPVATRPAMRLLACSADPHWQSMVVAAAVKSTPCG